jgi:hypothetical protein
LTRRLAYSWTPVRLHTIQVTTLVFGLVWLGAWNYRLRSFRVGSDERVFRTATAWASGHIPPNAVIFAAQSTGALYYYTGFTFVHFSFVTPRDIATIERGAAVEGRPVFAMLFPFERQSLLEEIFPGQWQLESTVGPVTFWRRHMPEPQHAVGAHSSP